MAIRINAVVFQMIAIENKERAIETAEERGSYALADQLREELKTLNAIPRIQNPIPIDGYSFDMRKPVMGSRWVSGAMAATE